VLARRHRFPVNAALDRLIASRADSIRRGGATDDNRVAAFTHPRKRGGRSTGAFDAYARARVASELNAHTRVSRIGRVLPVAEAGSGLVGDRFHG
jgi:hypothetical protein